MLKNVTRIKKGIKIDFGVSVKILKNITCVKKIIFGNQLHLVTKILNKREVLLTIQ